MKKPLVILCAIISFFADGQGINIVGGEMNVSSGTCITLVGDHGLTNNGAADFQTNSKIVFNGSSDQMISGSGTTNFANVDIDNSSADVCLQKDVSVSGTIQMNNGDLDLRANTIDLGTTGNLNGETSGSRIKATDGSGNDGLGVGQITALRTNPTGNVAGLGLDITPVSNLGVTRVTRGHERQAGSGSFTGNYSVFRYYDIEPATYSDVDFEFSYFPAFELNGHVDGNLIAFQKVQYFSGALGPVYWSPLSTTNTSPTATATTVFNILNTNIRVTLGSDALMLPIELLSFECNCTEEETIIEWKTAAEINNDRFEIEVSEDGLKYDKIASIKGIGNSNTFHRYSHPDENRGRIFYRLSQIDFDGTTTYFDPVFSDCEKESEINIFPNPNNGVLFIKAKDIIEINIVDGLGRNVYQVPGHLINFEISEISIHHLIKGVYTVQLINRDNEIYIKKLIRN